jgi:hypothetical protein
MWGLVGPVTYKPFGDTLNKLVEIGTGTSILSPADTFHKDEPKVQCFQSRESLLANAEFCRRAAALQLKGDFQ